MPNVLTTNSTVICGPVVIVPTPLHGGNVMITSLAKLTVNGNPILLKNSIENKIVNGCSTVANTNTITVTCTQVDSVTVGEAAKLTQTGKPVMLDTLNGTTNGKVGGTPQALLTAAANENKLTAI